MQLNLPQRLTLLLIQVTPGWTAAIALPALAVLVWIVGPFFAFINTVIFLLSIGAFCRLTVGTYRDDENMLGKTVLITGGAQGIGQQTAAELARRGARVIIADVQISIAKATARKIVEETGNQQVEALFLDLGSFSCIRNFAEDIQKKEHRLDVLINNAGVMQLPRQAAETIRKEGSGLDPHYVVNYLGPFLLTNLLLPLLKRSAPSRIVLVSSLMHRSGDVERAIRENFRWRPDANPNEELYSNSKLAVLLYAVELSERLRGTGVTANALHPGVTFTKITAHFPKWKLIFFWTFSHLYGRSVQEASQTTLFLSISSRVQSLSGKYFVDCKEEVPADCSFDADLRRRLWRVSQQITGLEEI